MKSAEGPEPERLFSLFTDLVSIDSESGMEGSVASYIEAFCSRLDLPLSEDSAGEATGGTSGNLVVEVPGREQGALTLPPVILNAHMDTVVPGTGIAVVDAGDRFVSGGETILGADCKAGLASILATVEALLSAGGGHRALELIFTVQEEPGLVGVKHLHTSLVLGRWGIVLDGSGKVGGIVVEAPGQDKLKFAVRGRSAHAGIEPEKGINAIACAADAIAGLRLGRHDQRTTSNIGIISGGSAVNIVPDLAQVEGEIRSLDSERLDRERGEMIASFRRAAGEYGCQLDVEVERTFHHFKLDGGSRPVRFLSRAMEECGYTPSLETSGGGSDANILNRSGLETAVMQIGLADAHSKEEYILKDDLVAVARIITRLAYVSADEAGEAGL